MSSASTRGFTVVTIVVLVFAPVLKQHGWGYKLVSRHQTTTTVACAAGGSCPATRTETKTQYLSEPLAAKPAAKPASAKGAKPARNGATKVARPVKRVKAKQPTASRTHAGARTRAKSAGHAGPAKKHPATRRRR